MESNYEKGEKIKKVNTKIVVESRKKSKMVSTLLYFGAGTKNDPKDIIGLSHFLEHILISPHYDQWMNVRYIGGDTVARTYMDFIMINHYVPVENWKKALKYLLNYLYNSEITKERVDVERDLIVKEWSFWTSSPKSKFITELLSFLFSPHPYGYKQNEGMKHINKITPSILEHYRNCFWNNITILMTGNVTEKQVVSEVGRYMDGVKIKEEKWDKKIISFPEEKYVEKTLILEGQSDFLGIGCLIKNPDIDDIISLHMCGLLSWFEDNIFIEALKKSNIPAISVSCVYPTIFFNEGSSLVLNIDLEKNVNKIDTKLLWENLTENFDLIKEKTLIHDNIQGLRNESVLIGHFINLKMDYEEFCKRLKEMDKERFFKTYENIDRLVVLYSKRKK